MELPVKPGLLSYLLMFPWLKQVGWLSLERVHTLSRGHTEATQDTDEVKFSGGRMSLKVSILP